jgi:hypothetical protein
MAVDLKESFDDDVSPLLKVLSFGWHLLYCLPKNCLEE